MNQPPPIVLCFSATDPSGGAGLQADILTLSSMGCHPLSVVTAITIQDSIGIEDIMPIDADWVADQARSVLEDMPVHAFKIGAMGSVENITVIAEIASDYPDIPLILDPVISSGRGDELATEEMLDAMKSLLIPQATLITPNSIEARYITLEEHEDGLSLTQCAERMMGMGAEYVLITGTHEHTPKVINMLYGEAGLLRTDSWNRLPHSYHGSGCTLASAIAAAVAMGLDMENAVEKAQEYTWNTLNSGFRPGMGQHIPDRFFWAREED